MAIIHLCSWRNVPLTNKQISLGASEVLRPCVTGQVGQRLIKQRLPRTQGSGQEGGRGAPFLCPTALLSFVTAQGQPSPALVSWMPVPGPGLGVGHLPSWAGRASVMPPLHRTRREILGQSSPHLGPRWASARWLHPVGQSGNTSLRCGKTRRTIWGQDRRLGGIAGFF